VLLSAALTQSKQWEAGVEFVYDQLQEDGDWQGAITWHRILDCIERIQARKPAEGERVH
jgi:hypothetical protein